MTSGIGAALLVMWGVLNAVGGALGARNHPAPWIGTLFLLSGGLIVAAGIGVYRRRSWALPLSAVALLGLSGVTLLSGALLRGLGAMRPVHHLVRAAISFAIFAIAWAGARQHRNEEVRS